MAKAQRDTIPFHKLSEHTHRGYHLKRISVDNGEVRGAVELGAHRDDHYIFILQEKGFSVGMIDFHLFKLKGSAVLYILPGQVHSYTEADETTEGWFLAIDADIIPGELRSVLEDPLLMRKPFVAAAAEMAMLNSCAELALTICDREAGACSRHAVHAVLTSLIALIAGLYERRRGAGEVRATRPQTITRDFRLLLGKEYKTLKSPADYAEALHLSAPYLNEAVKETTGFTVSYWIQQEVVLEAKRLLFHSPCSVKEIAYQLGYEDHTYFSRLFKKAVGKTPGEFRVQYRK